MDLEDVLRMANNYAGITDVDYGLVKRHNSLCVLRDSKWVTLEESKMKEITLNIDGKEIKATVSEEELEKLTTPEPSVRLGFAGSILKKTRENERARKEWPQVGDTYWWLNGIGEFSSREYSRDYVDENCELMGNMYRTSDEAQDARRAQKLIAAVAKRRKQLNRDWVPGSGEDQWFIFQYPSGRIDADWLMCQSIASSFGMYATKEFALTIIEEFHDELKWYFEEYTVSVN